MKKALLKKARVYKYFLPQNKQENDMPNHKMKTNKGVAKRFKLTKSGKVKKAKCFRGHLFTSKSRKRKRKMGNQSYCFKSEAKNLKKLLPYG